MSRNALFQTDTHTFPQNFSVEDSFVLLARSLELGTSLLSTVLLYELELSLPIDELHT